VSPGFRLYLITDRQIARAPLAEVIDDALAAAPAGAVAVQLREKDLEGGTLFQLARRLREVTRRRGALLFVNGRVDVALAAQADGVHLPGGGLSPGHVRRLFPGALVGISTHAVVEVSRARDEGADFAVLGPLYETPSKAGYGEPLGLAPVRAAAKLGVPIYGVGGVNATRAPAVVAAGARGVACISAVLAASDPGGAVSEILGKIGRGG
jgi:thiamine-phosphate pyrophosphorylase